MQGGLRDNGVSTERIKKMGDIVRSITIPPLAPTIEGSGWRLRPLDPADAPVWHAYLSDPVVIEHTSYPALTPEAVLGMIEGYRRGYAEGRSCRWALARQADDRLIGTCGFNEWSGKHGVAELAYDLAREHWGAGLMTAAVAAAVQWAFAVVGFNRIHAVVMVSNDRSVRLLERLRFTREGTLRSFRIARGLPRDFWMYSLLRAEWEAESSGDMAPR
jgi:[ribosomal protein S5]-alanine N-acetyltransferase